MSKTVTREESIVVTRTLTPEEIKELRKQLVQNPSMGARIGSTSMFPSLEELSKLREKKNCSVKFGKTYKLNKKLAEGGASGGTVFSVSTVGEQQRTKRLAHASKKMPLVLKVSEFTGSTLDEENLMDIVIGARINLLVAARIAPGFMRTVDWFVCHDFVIEHSPAKALLYVLTERQDMTILKYLSGVAVVEPQLVKSLLGQLLFTLESALESVEFSHNDLHVENVMVRAVRDRKMSKADFWTYKRHNGRRMWISSNDSNKHVVSIIDFGRSRIRFPKVGHFGKLKENETEILVLEGFEELGVREEFNHFWDIRRFALNFVEKIIDETHQRPLTDPRQPTSRKQKRPKDFFQALKRQNRAEYEAFMDVLDEMSGHRFVHTQESLGVGESNQSTVDMHLARLWEDYYHKLSNLLDDNRQLIFPNITLEEVNNVLGAFRDGGVRWLVKMLRAGQFAWSEYIERMWQWTAFEFPSNPTNILDMPFFENLYTKPKSRKATSTVVGEFRQLFDLGGRVDHELRIELQCSAPQCESVGAKQKCPCGQVVYCSDNCADAHWDKHSEVCEA